MFTVCIHGVGTTVVGKFIPTFEQRLSEFAVSSRNKSDKKDKPSH